MLSTGGTGHRDHSAGGSGFRAMKSRWTLRGQWNDGINAREVHKTTAVLSDARTIRYGRLLPWTIHRFTGLGESSDFLSLGRQEISAALAGAEQALLGPPLGDFLVVAVQEDLGDGHPPVLARLGELRVLQHAGFGE